MKKVAAHPEAPLSKNASSSLAVGSVMLTLADTTWRIAVPVIIFAGLGVWGDVRWHTKPWLTLLGTVVGFLLAALLVKQQLGDVQEAETAAKTEEDKS